jgi:hypothetical protein
MPPVFTRSDWQAILTRSAFLRVERVEAHGLPWDLWLVNVERHKFERLIQIGADSPIPVWMHDGKSILFFEATGFYLLDCRTNKITQISSDGGYGGFDWHA